MPHRFDSAARRRLPWGIVAAIIVVACSGNDKSFFGAPIPHSKAGGGGSAGRGGGSGKPGQVGGSGAHAGTLQDGAGAPDTGGAPDAGGTSNAGEPGTGGTGGSAARGGSTSTGGTVSTGGQVSTGGAAGATGGQGGSAGGVLGGSAGALAGGGGAGAGSSGAGGVGAGGAGAGGVGATAGMSGSSSCVPTVPSKEICDGIDNDCRGGIDDGPGVCPDGCAGAIYDSHLYLLCTGTDMGPGSHTYTRNEADAACGDYGDGLGTTLGLVRINSADENAFILGLIDSRHLTDRVWNAASDSSAVGSSEGTWVWGNADNGVVFYRDGAPVSGRYNDWAPGQPDNDDSGTGENCAVFDPDRDWHWDDVVCNDPTSAFVCEEPTRN